MWMAIIAGIAAVALLIAFLTSRNRRAKTRHKSVSEVGLMFSIYVEPFGPDPKVLEGTGLPLFIEGLRGVARNMIRFQPEDGVEACFFDYICETGAPGSEVAVERTVALFDYGKDMFSPFYLSADGTGVQPEIPGYGAADAGKFPGLPAGAKVYSDALDKLGALLNSGKTELFQKEPDWNVQGAGQYLLLYGRSSLVAQGGYQDFVKAAKLLALRLTA
ncbi:MAG TPA: hypothetical protein DCZ92_10760 [Elusimicrobia bacterium]|nr:MAG: hypothetical protein A2016_04450 [Elusimicrobia bacterium GWF2_62_30]HBA61275.1 hypothetical protein [Elusimicrobiota bacterium]